MKKFALLMFLLLLSACASAPATKTSQQIYDEWLATCKDYRDVARWLEKNFVYDDYRLKYAVVFGKAGKLIEVYCPWETFKEKKAVCDDAAVFALYSLNKMNPSYQAEIIYLDPGSIPPHYVCAFFIDGKLYIMDYGVKAGKPQRGVWGPFDNLSEYVKTVYLEKSQHRSLKNWHFGFGQPGVMSHCNKNILKY